MVDSAVLERSLHGLQIDVPFRDLVQPSDLQRGN